MGKKKQIKLGQFQTQLFKHEQIKQLILTLQTAQKLQNNNNNNNIETSKILNNAKSKI